jgi:hypothetical protein
LECLPPQIQKWFAMHGECGLELLTRTSMVILLISLGLMRHVEFFFRLRPQSPR